MSKLNYLVLILKIVDSEIKRDDTKIRQCFDNAFGISMVRFYENINIACKARGVP